MIFLISPPSFTHNFIQHHDLNLSQIGPLSSISTITSLVHPGYHFISLGLLTITTSKRVPLHPLLAPLQSIWSTTTRMTFQNANLIMSFPLFKCSVPLHCTLVETKILNVMFKNCMV